ncbi:hypothetical protein D9M73_118130 [compost metagenome]
MRDAQRGHVLAVERGVDRVVLSAQLDPRDIAQPRQLPLRVALDDDFAELIGRGQSPRRLDAKLEGGAALVERRSPHGTGRNLHVLCADGSDDFIDRQIARGGAIGIDPQPHIVIAPAEAAHTTDAGNTRNPVDDLRGRIIRHVGFVQRPVG